jgi:hypothetical protein
MTYRNAGIASNEEKLVVGLEKLEDFIEGFLLGFNHRFVLLPARRFEGPSMLWSFPSCVRTTLSIEGEQGGESRPFRGRKG